MSAIWIMVANGSEASLFTQSGAVAAATFVESWNNPTGRLKGADINTDRSGAARSESGSGGAQSLSPATDPRENELKKWSHGLADRLNQAIAQKKTKQVVLIMAPKVLGLVRGHLSPGAAKEVAWSADRDIAQLKPHEIVKKIEELRP